MLVSILFKKPSFKSGFNNAWTIPREFQNKYYVPVFGPDSYACLYLSKELQKVSDSGSDYSPRSSCAPADFDGYSDDGSACSASVAYSVYSDDGSEVRSSIGIGFDWFTILGPVNFSCFFRSYSSTN